MIKEIIHDPIFLAGKSEVATKDDLQVAQDLLDTLIAHREGCVGMAANMIGVRKCIIAFLDESGRAPAYTVMLNPELLQNLEYMKQRKDAFLFLKNRENVNDTVQLR
jgi:peptide deformylase